MAKIYLCCPSVRNADRSYRSKKRDFVLDEPPIDVHVSARVLAYSVIVDRIDPGQLCLVALTVIYRAGLEVSTVHYSSSSMQYT